VVGLLIGPAKFDRSILPFWLQPQRVLTVHGGHRVPVEADMSGGGMGVAPHPLKRLFEEDSLAAGGEE